MSSRREDRVAFVSERMSDVEVSRLEGVFRVRWDDEASGEHADGPSEALELDEALTWAREHAPVVFVELDDILFSAGERPEVDEGTRPWPAGGVVIRPRPIHTPFDGTVQRRYWGVVGTIETDDADESLARAVAADVSADPGARGVVARVLTTQGDPGIEVACELLASGMGVAVLELSWLLDGVVARRVPGGLLTGTQNHGDLPRLAPGDPI